MISFNFINLAGITNDLAKNSRDLPQRSQGVSGQFPPGQHCWSTQYVDSMEIFALKNPTIPDAELGFDFLCKIHILAEI